MSVRFSQADIRRAIKGAEEAGMRVGRVEIGHDGQIVLVARTEEPKTLAKPPLQEESSGIDKWRTYAG